MPAMDAGLEARFCERYRSDYFAIHKRATWFSGDVAQAHDLAQDVFTKAFALLAAGNAQVLEARYLYRLAVNHFIDWRRARRDALAVPFDETALSLLPASGSPDGERVVHAREILRRLPAKLQALAYHRHVEGCTLEELVALTGWSQRTVQRRLARVSRRLLAGR
jgi:RNA polymerase sigma factor (sigma-70 family)